MGLYKIERFHPGLLRGVAELRRSLFGKTLRANTAYFAWMYDQNPYIKEPPLFVALHSGVPVGMRGTLGTRWTCGSFCREHTLPSFTDTGIDPRHRDRGLYAELTSLALEEYEARGYSHVLNVPPTSENFLAATLSTGDFRSVGGHEPLVRKDPRPGTDRAERAARALYRRIPENTIVDRAWETWTKYHLGLGGSAVREARTGGFTISVDARPRPDDMAGLAARLNVDERIRHVRDSQYFVWRYRNPLAYHRFVYAEREADLAGYAVLQCSTSLRQVDIADLEAVDGDVRDVLLDTITTEQFGNLRIWSSTLARDLVSTLENYGFRRPVEQERYADRFILRPLAAGDDRWLIEGVDLRRLANWDLRAAIATTY